MEEVWETLRNTLEEVEREEQEKKAKRRKTIEQLLSRVPSFRNNFPSQQESRTFGGASQRLLRRALALQLFDGSTHVFEQGEDDPNVLLSDDFLRGEGIDPDDIENALSRAQFGQLEEAKQLKKQSALEALGVAHTQGSKMAQSRVTRSVISEREKKKRETEVIDKVLAEKKARELRVQKEAAENRRKLRKSIIAENIVESAQRRKSRISIVSESGSADWSLDDRVPLLAVRKSVTASQNADGDEPPLHKR